ncbi:btk-binding protein-related [Anaeramoeba flamelloides]|uniref:Btk-binding protein-related n=1 Tax=Anaeramoeba flamelloides TaxID=1746091 RepID=A0ABQ8XL85_9EUKA|nr:btk-binding protein-related [Anaeramoeba flamelloides]
MIYNTELFYIKQSTSNFPFQQEKLFENENKKFDIVKSKFEHKAEQIAFGENEAIWFTKENKFYSTKPNQAECVLFENPNSDPIKMVCSGFKHHLIVTSSGRVFLFGNLSHTQIRGQKTSWATPEEILFFKKKNLQVVDVQLGEWFLIFLCSNSEMYGGVGGVEGLVVAQNKQLLDPKRYTNEKKELHIVAENVRMISKGCATRCVFYLTNDNRLFSSGDTPKKSLGSKVTSNEPIEIKGLDNSKIRLITTGYQHTLILIGDSELYSCGEKGSCGFMEDTPEFKKLDYFNNIYIKDVVTAIYCSLVLSNDNSLYYWGDWVSGGNNHNITKIKLDQTFLEKNIVLASGSHTLYFYTVAETINEDFKQFYKAKEFTDIEINGFKAHKTILECRLNSKITKIVNILEKESKENISGILNWCYKSEVTITKREEIMKILQNFGITDLSKKTIINDLKLLYKDEDSKNFSILVAIDDDEDGEYIDDEEEEYEEIPVHKSILLARSGLFREMFRNTNQESNSVKDFSKKTIESIEILIKYLYTNKIELTADDDPELIVEELSDAVEYYQLNESGNFSLQLEQIKRIFLKK